MLRGLFEGSLANLGEVAQSQGKSAQAIAHYVESLMLRANLGDKEGIAYCLEGLADIAGARGQPKRAARLWGAAETLREELSVPLPPSARTRYDQLVAGTRASFGAAPFDAAFAAGRSMSLAQVTTEAQTMIGTRMMAAKKTKNTKGTMISPSIQSLHSPGSIAPLCHCRCAFPGAWMQPFCVHCGKPLCHEPGRGDQCNQARPLAC
jgi:hypothetical protein